MTPDPRDERLRLRTVYGARIERFGKELTDVRTRINSISNLRIATAVLTVACLYGGFKFTELFYVAIPLVAGFVALVNIHSRLFLRKVHLENLVSINTTEIAALSGDRSKLYPGSEFIDPQHHYSHDLDIFGEGSIFQLMNRANTFDGRRAVASLLNKPLPSISRVQEQQEAVAELSGQVDLRQDLAAAGLEINEEPHDREQLLAWLSAPTIAYGKPMLSTVIWLLPALTVTAWLLFLLDLIPEIVPFFFVFVQWGFWGRYSKRINVFHDYISRKKLILEKYAYMLAVIRQGKFENGQPQSAPLKAILEEASDAGEKVNKLASLVSQLNARLNFATAIFVNSLFLYDLRCVYRLEKWKAEHGHRLPAWLGALSDAEALSSIANFAYNHPHCRFPEIHNEVAIRAEAMGHPLLDPRECVTNNVIIGPAPTVLIVTGANMAGKSTFLRSIGVNVVLALAGAPVYASSFQCPVIPLRSGMRTVDSLKDHESYFYAELNRLKSIIDELREGKPLFILLDEILKGTNSNDKQKGSIALVHQLLEYPCLGIVATHDLALGAISHDYPEAVYNYCFEATIHQDQLSFDYKLKPGLAQNMNATFLMTKMGIIKKQ